ncbi:LysR family transcriptional regulator [Paracoccus laeviglucosivorans]|uniref:DNA-binding transcriptional regulator, LysR family n=1 Tax=Paracoccus laeviglucosivorans TaxID=1197861 RepID=A0A521FEP2_9RHOB|nr:LysR family transcriptional regulator [Paracoccus laeviglucosivorans]SMO94579.1 DNA-binding transcriptional regulator, LysR family [Paracoccus laeviglucosivorans]
MRISDFTLRNMRTFCAVADHRGFAGAQAVLGMSQSAVSTHIKDLEVTLGFALCRRGRGGFALTEKGEAVYAYARQMLSGIEDCEARLGTLGRVLAGHLRVGVVDSEADNPELPVHRAIRRFFLREQEVRLSLEVGTPEDLGKALQTGDIHVAIGPFPTRHPNIEYMPVYAEEHALFCGNHHPLFGLEQDISLEVLSQHPMTVRPYLQRAELAPLVNPRVIASVSNMEAQAILIRSGCFLGFLPVHFARKWLDTAEMRRIDLPGIGWHSQFFVALRAQPEPTEVAQLFARDAVLELAGGGN